MIIISLRLLQYGKIAGLVTTVTLKAGGQVIDDISRLSKTPGISDMPAEADMPDLASKSKMAGMPDTSAAPDMKNVSLTSGLIRNNLNEMLGITKNLSREIEQNSKHESRKLLYLASHLYDYYLLAEECLLFIARTYDRWVPSSIDWRYRLLKLMQAPIPDKRPPAISTGTALLLDELLILFLNFHRQCDRLKPDRVNRIVNSLPDLQLKLKNELTFFASL